jgi:class 3 adenylate cyclase
MKCRIHLSHRIHGMADREFDQQAISIGRSSPPRAEQLDIDLSPDRYVSRSHARLFVESGKWWIEDNESAHGTYLDGERIHGKVPLATGGEIIIGDWHLTIFYGVSFRTNVTMPPIAIETAAAVMGKDGIITLDTEKITRETVERLIGLLDLTGCDPLGEPPRHFLAALAQKLRSCLPYVQFLDIIAPPSGARPLEFEHLIPPSSVPAHISRTLAERVVTSRKALLLTDSAVEAPQSDSLHGSQIKSAMYIPLIAFGDLLGILCITSSLAGAFGDAEFTLARVAAHIAATGLHHHRLNMELRSREQAMANVRPHIPDKLWKLFLKKPETLEKRHPSASATIMVVDIRGFTALSEAFPSWEMAETLNDYLEQVITVIHRLDGITEKYSNDALIALFGIPEPDENQSEKALGASWEIQRMLKLWREMHKGDRTELMQAGIALHYGQVTHGFIGPERRMRYTAIGTPINIALKMCRNAGAGEILISFDAWNRVKEKVEVGNFVEFRGMGMLEPVQAAPVNQVHVL